MLYTLFNILIEVFQDIITFTISVASKICASTALNAKEGFCINFNCCAGGSRQFFSGVLEKLAVQLLEPRIQK